MTIVEAKALANPSCRHCHGRGYVLFQDNLRQRRELLLCRCTGKRHVQLKTQTESAECGVRTAE